MSKTTKNFLLVVTMASAITLVVFTIQLIILNRDADGSGGNSISISAASSGESNSVPVVTTGTAAGNGRDSAAATGEYQPNQTTQQPLPASSRFELLYNSSYTLVLHADENLFEHDPTMEMSDMFTYKDGGNASLLIHFISFPYGIQRSAESLLTNYLDGNPSYVHVITTIKNSPLTGLYVTGVTGTGDDEETFEAWIHSISDNDSAASNDYGMAFIIRYRTNKHEQRNALYAVLDSLELTAA